jgi:hypothetical protein
MESDVSEDEERCVAEGAENWRLILEAARALTNAGQAPFTRLGAYKWIWRRYPRRDHDRPSLDPTFQGMINNAPGGPPSAYGTRCAGSVMGSTFSIMARRRDLRARRSGPTR